ncbi:DEAD/DEAH box helicase [Natronoglycomyces albus]|uniref:DEAD/DEAH box helicase n=1 Tax=Natronoglycomyces albus TaxID=2811108 RepID=A0A895XWE8_9ACTN|nr:DEAD/DEAH box helicase [Natronoglycomyces albus]QSB06846.1 DEAD/DEAH box helicase [Natronoglycomyces albus]
MLPASLHATFEPDPHHPSHGRMLLWGGDDPATDAATLGLPPGDPATAHILQGDELVETDVLALPARPAAAGMIHLADRIDIAPSLAAWGRVASAVRDRHFDILDKIAEELPIEGHSAADPEGHVWTARAAVAAFVESHAELGQPDSGLSLALTTAQHALPETPRVQATLRPYQANGIAWLQTATDNGAGVVLADDMGLGKTLQSIGLLAARSTGEQTHLVVCPTSVVGNWQRELARFAPQLTTHLHHGPKRRKRADELLDADVIITSYSLALRDRKLLGRVCWDTVILDEAQTVKNHRSQTSKAVRGLTSRQHIALTGTPVENRLAELWAIMEFVNPGLLGTQADFKRRFTDPIEIGRDPNAARELRELIGPVVLRRLKEDVAADLPKKLESVVVCTMTAEQGKLYKEAVADAFDSGLGDGIARRGNILKLLTRLKQICNHPVQAGPAKDNSHDFDYDHEPEDNLGLADRSGKLDRIAAMLAEVIDSGDRALIFTQYRTMGELLATHIREQLNINAPFLHGGVDQMGRDRMVQHFQTEEGPGVLLVSLKAGGTGLNLTAASHVFHYDRWWNPAVEDQATDRAHRIGQTRTVHVHKLVTAGTLEERIDELLMRKRALADAIVGESEEWLTELDDTQLRKLIELDEDEVAQ